MPHVWLLAITIGSFYCSAVSAQTSAPASDVGTITLTPQLTLARLVDLCALQYDIDVEYQPNELTKQLTIRSGSGYTQTELWTLLHQLLEANGLTTVIAPGDRALYRVVPIKDAIKSASIAEAIPEPAPGYLIKHYPVEPAAREEIIDALGKLLPPVDGVSVSPDGRGVLVGALTRRHADIEARIDSIETRIARSSVTLRSIEHADPIELIAQIKAFNESSPGQKLTGLIQLGPKSGTILLRAPEDELRQWENLIKLFDIPGGIETRSYPVPSVRDEELVGLIEQLGRDPTKRGSGEAWRVVPNSLTNSLVITASNSEHTKISQVVDQINSIPPGQRRVTQTFVVKNRNAEDLRISLENLLGISVGQRTPLQSESASGVFTPPPNQSSDSSGSSLIMSVDDELNTIIAIGSPMDVARAAELIERLDIRQPQVQLEILLISLSEGESKDLGVELQAQIGDSGTLLGLGSIFGLSSISPTSSAAVAAGTGGTAVLLDPGDYSVVIKALERVSNGRSVSRANTLVNNNESASVSNTVQQPFSTTTLDDGDSITSFGGSESAGTQISVTPQIAEGDFLVLTYDVGLSAFIGEATSEGLPPPSQNTSISSVATIPDGYAIVVGGLELLTDSDADTKTPLLGDIPILGNLFKSQTQSLSNTRFYLFIRASILRNPAFEQLKYISDRAVEESGADIGWPTVRPKVIR
jgi:type II secretory pathway component GspD/PulD (secretin)